MLHRIHLDTAHHIGQTLPPNCWTCAGGAAGVRWALIKVQGKTCQHRSLTSQCIRLELILFEERKGCLPEFILTPSQIRLKRPPNWRKWSNGVSWAKRVLVEVQGRHFGCCCFNSHCIRLCFIMIEARKELHPVRIILPNSINLKPPLNFWTCAGSAARASWALVQVLPKTCQHRSPNSQCISLGLIMIEVKEYCYIGFILIPSWIGLKMPTQLLNMGEWCGWG